MSCIFGVVRMLIDSMLGSLAAGLAGRRAFPRPTAAAASLLLQTVSHTTGVDLYH